MNDIIMKYMCLYIYLLFMKIMNIMSGISSILAMGLLSPVQSMLSLMILFLSTSFCLYLQGFELIGLLYMLMYVGAIAILFTFILSLLNIEYLPKNNIQSTSYLLFIFLIMPLDLSYEADSLIMNLFNINNELITIGDLLYSEYAIIFMLSSIILVMSVVGAMSVIKC
ncbi:NADH dehydrogenase subunit 6 (mitochondrion) [Australozyma saopauloensis]|uniref:NADH-ubiquinone oxidoreductase chain 6 n=1 Tax=Australozyma saopauloensis TaxID=291208 RepID=A0AAX4HH75_9ASCO|nr:NADH dehydrogenase subunit 6 [[Candida] saopauloensis]